MISVIIPCYNCAKFVSRAVESVLGQNYSEWELILVNNNSSDNTLSLLNEFKAQYPGKIQVFDEKTKGAPAARNKGLSKAKGEWVQFLDADDEILPSKFFHQVGLLRKNAVDILVGSAKVNGREIGKITKSKRSVRPIDPWIALISSNMGITSANLFKRKALNEVDGWDQTLTSSQEYDLMYRMLKSGATVMYDTEELTVINVDGQGISRGGDVKRRIEIVSNRIDLRLKIKEYLKEQNRLTRIVESHIDRYIYASLKNEESVIPMYVRPRLRELKLRVPFYFKLLKGLQKRIEKFKS